MRRRLVALAIAIAMVSVPTAVRAADDGPLAREPHVHQELSRAPSAITLAFAWTISSESARIFVLDNHGKSIVSAAPAVVGTNVSVQLDYDLAPGTYSVYYQVSNRGGGILGGAYQFAVGKGTWTKLKTPKSWTGVAEQPTIFRGANPNAPATKKDLKPQPSQSPGLEIVRKDGTIEHPADIHHPKKKGSGGSHAAWFIAGGAVLVMGAGAIAVALRRRESMGAHDQRQPVTSSGPPSDDDEPPPAA